MEPFHWKNLFCFSKRERRGVYTLLLLLLLLLLFRGYIADLIPSAEPVADSLFAWQVEQWLSESQPNGPAPSQGERATGPLPANRQEIESFRFDPNQASRQELERLGLNTRVVTNLLRYREKGGRFDAPQDLLKIYGMDSSTFLCLKDCVWIAGMNRPAGKSSTEPPDAVHREASHALNIDLNIADTFQLMQLPGIGEVYARRICKYRDLLGGYAHAGQLHEVYGLAPSVVDTIEKHLIIDTLHIRPIAINRATFRELIRHPYLGEYQTKAILDYRDYRKGEVVHINELLLHNILDQKTYQKIEPYLVADP
ncbi:MAG: helix-hairpin-helix domain-containing protein [Bacteroidales bacterium]|nr:helix-hairpin-helix domain-containing protein [Bacteroidales bacterium]